MARTLHSRKASHQFDVDGGSFDEPRERKRLPAAIVVLVTLVAATLLVIAFLLGGAFRVTRAGSCASAADDLATVSRLDAEGQPAQAAALAHLDLLRNDLCPSARHAFAEAAYQGDVASLLTKQHQPGDIAGERQIITKWRESVTFARAHHLTSESPAQLSQLAFELGYWEFSAVLTTAAGVQSASSRSFLYSALVNEGREFATEAPPLYRHEGLAYLVLARDLAHQWRLPRGEADRFLERLAGSDPRRWPAPAASSLLIPGHHR